MSSAELTTMIKITQVVDDNKKTKLGLEMNYDVTPRVHAWGQLNLIDFSKLGEQKLVSYYIMPHYQMNLQKYLNQLKGLHKMKKVIDVAIKILNIFKYVHCAKRTYNDLKLTNIMVNTDRKLEADPEVFLIDFGFSDKFLT